MRRVPARADHGDEPMPLPSAISRRRAGAAQRTPRRATGARVRALEPRGGSARTLRRVLAAIEPARPRRRAAEDAATVVLFAAVFALKLSGALAPEVAPSTLFVLPVALTAVSHGLRGGVGGAGLAFLLLGASELVQSDHLGPLGLAVRGTVFLVSGLSLGLVVERLRAGSAVMQALSRGLGELGDGLVVLDEDAWTVLHASPAAGPIYDRTPDAVRGLTLGDLADPGEHARLEQRRRLRRAGHDVPARGEFSLRRPSGDLVRAEVAAMPVALDRRRLWMAVVRDVTPRRDAERRIAADHAFLQTVLETAATPIGVLDAHGRVIAANRAAERLAGLGTALMAGQTPWDLGLIDRAEVSAAGAALRAGGDPVHHVAPWRTADGTERLIAWTATAVREPAGAIRHAVTIGIDITEQRAAEDRARRAQAALELNSRELERASHDLARFATATATDLREPLRVAARALADAVGKAERDALARAGAALAELELRLQAVQDYGRLTAAEPAARDVDVEATVDAVLRDLADAIAARGAEVTRDRLPTVAGDPAELQTLLAHLVRNAVAAGGEGRRRVHVGAARRGVAWQLTVADNGAGVPEGERRQILQGHAAPGRRAGVGLAVCRRIAERHGGAIWVDDAAGGGTAFHVTLPDREAR
jgi:PAS domain S-box-containing protein